MTSRVLIVLIVDGLRARALGAYGNTSFETPALNELASESLVFDRVLGESTDLGDVYDALWTGEHVLNPSSSGRSLIAELTKQGYFCHLVTDDLQVAERPGSEIFEHVTLLEHEHTEPAAEVFDTAMGLTIEAAADVLGEWSAEYEQPRLLWIHLQGLTGPWDAPTELAESLRDEDDPQLTASIEPAAGEIAASEEGADEAFLAGCRYAAQVMALDRSLGALNGLLAELLPEVPVTLVVAGARGYALGEHGRLGMAGPAYRELFHVPLLVRSPQVAPLRRNAELLQTSDLYALLAQLAGSQTLELPERKIAVGVSDSSRYVETAEWSWVTMAEDERAELYVQPDDLWQANDVASLCPTELESFAELSKTIGAAVADEQAWHTFELPEVDLHAAPDD